MEGFYEIGEHARVDPGVILGYRYPGDREPTRIGDHAIIRSGSVIYTDTVIGHRFQCGHQVVIRAETSLGDRCVVHHQCVLEGRIRIGFGVKIMAGVYLPSTTVIGDLVFIGPGTTFLNAKYPMRRDGVEGARVEDGACIGGGVTVCPGVTIGRGAFVGAGALVNKDVPPGVLACGVPVNFRPMPEALAGGNRPELLLPQTDLWGAHEDESWREERGGNPL